jgi:hypothetical protein
VPDERSSAADPTRSESESERSDAPDPLSSERSDVTDPLRFTLRSEGSLTLSSNRVGPPLNHFWEKNRTGRALQYRGRDSNNIADIL